MTIQVFNTLSAKKENFIPLQGNSVNIYACGPTVYDLSHIGHARVYIVWDVIQRYLRALGYDVTFVRNITDIEDKIINQAAKIGVRPEQLTREYTYSFWQDMHLLNVASPDFEPRATEFVGPMIQFIQQLIEKGAAYAVSGDVYFDVPSFKNYGKLSKQALEQLVVGARNQVRSQKELRHLKRSPVDFALWKGTDKKELGWESPWGWGRPGWHLECSTMIKEVLGETIDIHGGGEDLVFPHHENEIAQSESLHGKPLARYWLHNSFVQVNSEKMSKSLGNFNTIQDLLKSFSADTIRLFILQTHYRNPIDFTPESLVAAKTALQRLIRAASLANDHHSEKIDVQNVWMTAKDKGALLLDKESDDEIIRKFHSEFTQAMDSDFNTAIALSVLFNLADKILQSANAKRPVYASTLKRYAEILGFTLTDTRQQLDPQTTSKVLELILELRHRARTNKDYPMSDHIRTELSKLGINVMDTTSGGSSWEKV
jgi:cysteinyl-tRNA synthetase